MNRPRGRRIDVAELLAGEADRRRVDDRHHLGQVVEQEPVEQRLVRVLKLAEVDVPLEVGRLSPVRLVGTGHLLLQRLLVRRQQAEQAEGTPFFRRERRPLVEQGAFEQQVPAERHLDDVGGDGVRQDRFDVHPSISRCSAGSVMGFGLRKGDSGRESQHERDKLMIAKSSPAWLGAREDAATGGCRVRGTEGA